MKQEYLKVFKNVLFSLGLDYTKADYRSDTLRTPWSIRRSPKSVVAAFISGVFDGDGYVDSSSIIYKSLSLSFLQELQLLLLNFGIISSIQELSVRSNFYYVISITEDLSRLIFLNEIQFKLEHKQVNLSLALKRDSSVRYTQSTYFYDTVVSIEESSSFCIDLSVPGYEEYVANGFTNHNTLLCAIIAAYEFYYLTKLAKPQEYYNISTNTPISILVLATTADQGKNTIYRQIAGIFKNSPYFNTLIRNKEVFLGKEEIAHEAKGIYIQSGNSRSSSQVGLTIKCLIMDEVARFSAENGDSNALTLWSNLGASCGPFREKAKRLAISSAWYEGDAIQVLYNMSYKDRDNTLGMRLRSWDVNPIHGARDNPIIASGYALNPIKAALEYEGVRPAYVDAFLNEHQIDSAFTLIDCIKAKSYISQGLVCLQLDSVESYTGESYIHVDPGIKSDSYALALGHKEIENKQVIVYIDSLLLWEPTLQADVSITNVGEIIRQINKSRPLRKVTADHYNSVETIQRLKHEGIRAEVVYFSNKIQLLMYDNLRQLLHENRIRISANSQWAPIAIRELKQIQLIGAKKIDHPKEGSKDLADAIAAVAYFLTERLIVDVTPKTLKRVQVPTYTAARNQSPRDLVVGSLRTRKDWQQSMLRDVYKENNELF